MGKLARIILLSAVLVVWASPLLADALSEQRQAQNKLMAARAARADAMRKIAERIKGLNITSETYVKDFVAESDTIQTAMRAFLLGMREVGKPKYYEDGTCEVTMEVTLKTVIANLKQIRHRHYKGDKFKAQDFDKMTLTNKLTVITEIGSGAIREDLEEPGELISAPDTGGRSLRMGAKAKTYWMAHCTARGRLMAVRAARTDAMRRLAERIKGVMITSETLVQDFVAESDEIDVSMQAFLRGARETGIRYHDDELIVEIRMEVTLREVFMNLKTWGETHYKGDRVKIKRLEELIVKSRDKIIKETGMGIPPAQYCKGIDVDVQAAMSLGAQAPPWITQKLRATGNSAIDTDNTNLAQAKLMARRGAELDARRKLAEQIDGLVITSETTVRDFIAEDDQIETSMLAYQQGARVLDNTWKLMEDGTGQIDVEIELKPLWNMIVRWQRRVKITVGG